MKLEGDYLFEASVPEVWSALFDPVILAAVMPGCEKLELVDGHYVGEIKVKVGPIQGKFAGKVDLKDKVEPHSYTMIVDGRGAPGFIKATASVKLAPEGNATRVTYDSDAQIGGKIASVGQRLIEASARAIVAQSLEGLHTNIKLRAAAYREAAAKQAADAPVETLAVAATIDPAVVEGSVTRAEAAADAVIEDAELAARPKAPPIAEPGDISIAAAAAVEPPASALATTAPSTIAPLPDLASAATPASAQAVTPAASTPAPASPAASTPAPAVSPAAAAIRSAAVVTFTPVKTKQSALANAVAKEVASTLFPRSVLVAIILIQALVIVWLVVRH
jgi:carbon monoxide dehydrogenase subunit G